MFRYTTTKRSKFDSGEKQESRSHRVAGNLTFVFGIPNLRNAVRRAKGSCWKPCDWIIFHRLLFQYLFHSLHLFSFYIIWILRLSYRTFREMLSRSLIYSQYSHAEIREQPWRKSSFHRKLATTQRSLRFLDERSIPSYFVFSLWKYSYLLPYPFRFYSPQKSELPVRAGLREVKEEEESTTPEGAPNPCGSWRERHFTDY